MSDRTWKRQIDQVMEEAIWNAFDAIVYGSMNDYSLTREEVMNYLGQGWDLGDYFAEWYDEAVGEIED